MWIKLLLALAVHCAVSEATSCSQESLPATDATCLDGLKNILSDRASFWFGTGYATNCPPPKFMSIECFTSLGDRLGSSATELAALDLSRLDRTLNITFVSPPGEYVGCDHRVAQELEMRFPVDPLAGEPMTPWYARELPELSWRADEGKQYTLAVVDVASPILHAMYINIEGNDVAGAKAIEPYHGPSNPSTRHNLQVYLVFEQAVNDMADIPTEVRDLLFAPMALSPTWKIGELATQMQLTGPVAVSLIRTRSDRYSLAKMGRLGFVSDCVPYVVEAYHEQEHDKRPFLPEDPDLSINVRVQFHNKPLSFLYCCQETDYPEREFFLDPYGGELVTAAETRADNDVTVRLEMNKMFPNASKDFAGKMYTLLSVDPDVPFPDIANNSHPLVHWLSYNNQVDAKGMLVLGNNTMAYRGPMPPPGEPHDYYFLLLEQTLGAISIDASDFAATECPNAEGQDRFRCQFDVNALLSAHALRLVGLTWMTAQNDDFINFTRYNGGNQDENCGERYPCPAPDPSAAPAALTGTLWMLWMALGADMTARVF